MNHLASLLMILTGFSAAQSHLKLTAEPVSAVWSSEERGSVKIEIQVALKIKNLGNDPVLLLTAEGPAVVGVYIGRSESLSPSSADVAQYWGPGVDTSKKWTDLAVRVQNAPLAESGLSVLRPGESREVSQDLVFYLPKSKRETLNGVRSDMPFDMLIETKDLWVSFLASIWPNNLERAGGRTTLGKKVRRKRRSDGLLAIDPLLSLPVRLVFQK